jgi:hypothetical protein
MRFCISTASVAGWTRLTVNVPVYYFTRCAVYSEGEEMVEPGPPRRVRRRRGPALHGQVNRLQVRREGRMLGVAL